MKIPLSKYLNFVFLLLFVYTTHAQNIGIGTTEPTATLHLNSQIQDIPSLDVDFEEGILNPGVNNSDLKWGIDGELGADESEYSMKSPYLAEKNLYCSILFPYSVDLGKIVELSFAVKFDAATDVRRLDVIYEGQTFSLQKNNSNWKTYQLDFSSNQVQGDIEFRITSLVDETIGTVRIDNIYLTYETGQALKITDGQVAEGNFLQTDGLGHVRSYDLRSEIEEDLQNNLQSLNFNSSTKQLSIENGNAVNISSMRDRTEAYLTVQDTLLLGSSGLSLHLPKNGPQQAYLFWDRKNSSFYTGRDPSGGFAKGAYSTRFGLRNTATDLGSTSFGIDNNSHGRNSFVFGQNNVANAFNSVSWGMDNYSTDSLATVWGLNNKAQAFASTAWGMDNYATDSLATVWGLNNKAQAFAATAWGMNNFIFDSLGTAFGENNVIYGANSFAAGDGNVIFGDRGFVLGQNNTINGNLGFSMGLNNQANGNNTVAWGLSNSSFGVASTSIGNNNQSYGQSSFATGAFNDANGDYSATLGKGLHTFHEGEVAVGRYNYTWNTQNEQDDFLFTVGNGTSSTDLDNAFVVLENAYCGINRDTPEDYLDILMNSNDREGIRLRQLNEDGGAQVLFEGFNQQLSFTSTNNPGYQLIHQDNDANKLYVKHNFQTVLMIDENRIGIMEPWPDYQLHLNNNSAAKPSSSSWIVASDQRLKENVKPFQDGLELVQKINPVWFTYNGEAGLPRETAVGTLAQELQKIAPYMVHSWQHRTDENMEGDSYLAVDYGAMDFVLINAIQEQQEMIAELEEKVAKQQAAINLQSTQIQQLIELQSKTRN